nr:thioredoxin domain-containing protein [Fodinibius halophilus]
MFGGIQPIAILISAVIFVFVTSAILLLKINFNDAQKVSQELIKANRVKSDPEVFVHFLRSGEQFDISPFSNEITLGNPEAPLRILVVANLHCNPCRMAFSNIQQLLSIYPSQISFTIRFTRGRDNTIGELSASTYLIRYWQQHIQGTGDEQRRTQTLIADWYEEMDPDWFRENYKLQESTDSDLSNIEEQHYAWIAEQEISATPTFIINGFKMPGNYRSDDLIALVPGVADLLKTRRMAENKNGSKELA